MKLSEELTLKSGKTISLNQAFNMDCLDFMKELPDKCIDLVLTDPPYIHEKGGRGKMMLGESLDRDKFNMKELGDFGENSIYDLLNESERILKKTNMYLFCSEKQLPFYLNWVVKNKKKFNLLTWNKPVSVMNRERYSTNIEYIVRIYNKGCALNKLDFDKFPEKTKYYSKYKTFNQIRGNDKYHPSQKPIEMLNQLVELSSNEKDIIFDPFLGSYSTAISTDKLNRNWLGCEKDLGYFKSGYHRYEQETKQMLMEL